MTPTGYDNGLCQDYNRKLGRWFADRLGAREQLRRDFPMSKYLITEAQRDAILSIPGYQNLKDEIAALKPIEPLSDAQIMEIVSNKPFNSAIGFARAIERHILGETP